MNKLFPRSTEDFIACYMVDVLVFSPCLEGHLCHLALVWRRLLELSKSLNPISIQSILLNFKYLFYIYTCK